MSLYIDATITTPTIGVVTRTFGPYADRAEAERGLSAFIARENALGATIRDPDAGARPGLRPGRRRAALGGQPALARRVNTPANRRYGDEKMDTVTRSQFAMLLEDEAHNAAAERVRCGDDPIAVLSDISGDLSRCEDAESRTAHAIFDGIARGSMTVLEDAR